MPSIRNSFLLLAAVLSLTSTASPVLQGKIGSSFTSGQRGSNFLPVRKGGPGSNSSPGGPPVRSSSTVDGCPVYRTVTPDPTSTSSSAVATSTVETAPTTVAKLPTTGALPATNNTVKFVAVGRGIQNYSCAAVNATPVATGAIAVLWDYTSLASSNETELNTLPGLAVNVPFDPFPLDGTPTSLAGLPAATVLGHHFFAADGTPTFNLTGANMILFGNKTATVTAPVGSPLGPNGTGSVAWLQLEAKVNIAAETSVGITEAYRVQTAGGNPMTLCSSAGTQSIPYASEYWFFD